MGDFGIKVGANVQTDADASLKFTTKYGSLKAYKWGDTNFTPDANGAGSVTVAHNLNYAPSFLVFRKIGSSFYSIGSYNSLTGDGDANIGLSAYSGTANLTIESVETFGKLGQSQVNFRYYIFVDKIQSFSGTGNVGATGDFGIKVSRAGTSVLTAQEYDMNFSSKYKSLQYYSENIKESTITLPLNRASLQNTSQEEYSWIDFNHGLGYPPFFLVWFIVTPGKLQEIPYHETESVISSVFGGGVYEDFVSYEVSAMCDSTKVRVKFYRSSIFNEDSDVWAAAPVHSAQTITVRVLPFAESLTSGASS